MNVKEYLQRQHKEAIEAAKAITTLAENEGRSVTTEEAATVEGHLQKAAGFLKQIEDIESTEKLREQIDRMNGAVNTDTEQVPAGVASSLGDAFVKSDAYQALVKGGLKGQSWTTGPVELPPGVERKATLDEATSVIVQPDVQPGVQLINQRRLVVADLFASGTTRSNVVRYLVETVATNAAAAVAEGGTKPESTLTLDEVDEPVRKIATFLPVSDEMLEDEEQIRSYVDARLRLFVALEEEEQLLIGDGTAPNLSGVLDRSGIQTATRTALQTASGAVNPTQADAIFQAITNIRVNALAEPDGIVFHPTNWAQTRLLKDANDQYFGGGPFTGAYGNSGMATNSIWGLTAVVTPVLTLNTVIVGAFATQGQVFRKGGITVEASNSHADFFQKNLTAIRAEERLALAIYRPAAFHAITAYQTGV